MAGVTIGSIWKSREGSKSEFSGIIDMLGVQIRVCLFKVPSDKKAANGPDYRIVSYGISEKNPQAVPTSEPIIQRQQPMTNLPSQAIEEDLPF